MFLVTMMSVPCACRSESHETSQYSLSPALIGAHELQILIDLDDLRITDGDADRVEHRHLRLVPDALQRQAAPAQ